MRHRLSATGAGDSDDDDQNQGTGDRRTEAGGGEEPGSASSAGGRPQRLGCPEQLPAGGVAVAGDEQEGARARLMEAFEKRQAFGAGDEAKVSGQQAESLLRVGGGQE